MISKEDLKIGMSLKHKYRGYCHYSKTANYLELTNPDETTLFVEFDTGELVEVTLNLVEKDDRISLKKS